MPSTLEIRRRIRSIKSTRQITKAMEMVAAAKMRKAQTQANSSRTYAKLAWNLVSDLASATNPELHKLLRAGTQGTRRVGLITISANRGLAGSFTSQLLGAVQKAIKASSAEVEVITMGRKGRDALRKTGANIVADFEKIDYNLTEPDVRAMADLAINDFMSGRYDQVMLAYTDFVSILVQKPVVRQLLPITSPIEGLGDVGINRDINNSRKNHVEYLFEPSADKVLETLLPRLIRMQIYQATLESNASEHSARMVAMKNASDAASDLVDELTMDFNRIRQAAITKEISEIVAGSLTIQ